MILNLLDTVTVIGVGELSVSESIISIGTVSLKPGLRLIGGKNPSF